MAIPVWSVGQVLTAADVNGWLTPTFSVYKTTGTTRNTLTLSADPDLTGTLPYANAFYLVTVGLNYNAASGGFAWSYSPPTGYGGAHMWTVSAGVNGNATWASTTPAGNSSATGGGIDTGMISLGATTGTFALTWASQSGPSSCTLNTSSYMTVQRAG